jgi:hypothetical protein
MHVREGDDVLDVLPADLCAFGRSDRGCSESGRQRGADERGCEEPSSGAAPVVPVRTS